MNAAANKVTLTTAWLRHYSLQTFVYTRIALHVAWRSLTRMTFREWLPFLRRATLLLWSFRHNRVVRIKIDGRSCYKLQLYLPAYPRPAFFQALDNKLRRQPAAPTSVVFSMTRACGYHCPHCYQQTEHGADLPEELLVQTLLQVQDAGVTFFNIEGGEPLLRFERLLTLCTALGDDAEVWINTTGSGGSRERLAQLQAAGVVGIMVSLHSSEATLHDDFTGVPGSFVLACATIQQARLLGLGVAVNSVLAEGELRGGGLDTLMERARILGADFVQLIHPKPCGPWLERSTAMQQEPALLHFVEQQHLFYNGPQRTNYPALAAQAFEERPQGLGCTAGAVERFYITATGEMQPCEFLQISFGNVTIEPFAEIYQRMRAAFAKPCCNWLCCTQAAAITALLRRYDLQATPLPWPQTKELLTSWQRGEATPLYQQLELYP